MIKGRLGCHVIECKLSSEDDKGDGLDKVGPHCLLLDLIQGETGHYRHCTSPSGF